MWVERGSQMIAWIRPSQLIVLAWLAALAWSAPRTWRPWAAAALALVLRAWAYGPDIHMHAGKAYHLLDTPFRHVSADLRYGDAWPALMVLAGAVLRHGDTVHLVNTAVAVLTVPFLFAAVLPVAGEAVAFGAALLLAVLPLAVASADHEHQLIVVALCQAAAVAGMLGGRDRKADALAATSLGMLAHSRPLEIVEAWLGIAWLVKERRWRAVLGASVLVVWRTVELAVFAAGGGNVRGAQFDSGITGDLLHHLVGDEARIVPLDPTVTPLAVGVLAFAGAAHVLRQPRARILAVIFLLDVGLYVLQPLVYDRIRLQLPAQVWVAALAAVACAELWRSAPRAGWAVAVAAAVSFWPARAPFEPAWPWQVEYRALREGVRGLPDGATIAYDGDVALGEWVSRRVTPSRPGIGGQHIRFRWVPSVGSLEEGMPPSAAGVVRFGFVEVE